jgi:Undecaprenyl-phosphate galactose phosphotransferase WbaP
MRRRVFHPACLNDFETMGSASPASVRRPSCLEGGEGRGLRRTLDGRIGDHFLREIAMTPKTASGAVAVQMNAQASEDGATRVGEDGRRHRITDRALIRTVRRANGGLKRVFDAVVAGAGLVALAPFLAVVWALVKLSDGGPAFFGHVRVGRYGRPFTCWKFRTMVQNGDEVLARHLAANPAAAEEWKAAQKLRKDPRVTAIGAFLRITSLDELPQLWNVLVGEMSLVGPRPVTRTELERYAKDRKFYLLVRPGLTGLWQVSGRNRTSYARRVALDRHYVQTWSFLGDLWIMLKTVVVLARRDGC